MEAILFYILSALTVIFAIFAITRVNPIAVAVFLAACFVSIGGIFGLLGAPLIALFQIILTAGAVMVFFIFVIMMMNLDPDSFRGRRISLIKILASFLAAYFLAITLIAVVRPPFLALPDKINEFSSAHLMGKILTEDYAIPFELMSVLLLTAMVAAFVMGRRQAR